MLGHNGRIFSSARMHGGPRLTCRVPYWISWKMRNKLFILQLTSGCGASLSPSWNWNCRFECLRVRCASLHFQSTLCAIMNCSTVYTSSVVSFVPAPFLKTSLQWSCPTILFCVCSSHRVITQYLCPNFHHCCSCPTCDWRLSLVSDSYILP